MVQGNYSGTNAAGSAALPLPSGFGIGVNDLGNNNTIGGVDANAPGAPLAGAGNLISGFAGPAVALGSTGGRLQGNLIGTDTTGTQPIPNSRGVEANFCSANYQIGGTTPGAGNTIAFNNRPPLQGR